MRPPQRLLPFFQTEEGFAIFEVVPGLFYFFDLLEVERSVIVLIGKFIKDLFQVIEAGGEPKLLIDSGSLGSVIVTGLGKVENLLLASSGSSVLRRNAIRPLALGEKRNKRQS